MWLIFKVQCICIDARWEASRTGHFPLSNRGEGMESPHAWLLYTLNDLGTCDQKVGLFATKELAIQSGMTKLGGAPFDVKYTLVEWPQIYKTVQEFEDRGHAEQMHQLAKQLTPEQIALVRSAAFAKYIS